jgi:hypothetical protein
LDDLDPVIVWVKNKSYVFHAAVCKALLPVHTQVFEALAGCVEVVY